MPNIQVVAQELINNLYHFSQPGSFEPERGTRVNLRTLKNYGYTLEHDEDGKMYAKSQSDGSKVYPTNI